jgi:prevent-host-death family protein
MSAKKSNPGGRASDTDVIAVSEFKTRCLEILEGLRNTGHELVVTKHGSPIARVVPVTTPRRALRGLMKGEMEIVGDIVQADFSNDWEANR